MKNFGDMCNRFDTILESHGLTDIISMSISRVIMLMHILTRSSADADNRLDAFSGQSRSTNMVPFHMLHI